jgi:hypothetical protein
MLTGPPKFRNSGHPPQFRLRIHNWTVPACLDADGKVL